MGGTPPDHSIPLAPAPITIWNGVSETGRWAIAYAERGWPIFPVVPGGKEPETLGGLLKHGYKDASTNPQIVAGWWRKAHDMGFDPNIGLAPDKGWLVIDIDDPKNARQAISEEAYMGLKTAPWVQSGREGGGFHFYFRVEKGTDLGPMGARGWCDLKGDDRGYVVAPPSLHPSGKPYRWGSVGPIPTLPQPLIDALGTKPDDDTLITVSRAGYTPPDIVPEGGRYAAILQYTASRYKKGLSNEEIWTLVKNDLAGRFTTPLSEPDLRERFDRAMKGIEKRLGPPNAEEPFKPKQPTHARVKSLSNYRMKPIDWLMRGWFSKGQITILEGWGGMSKSTVMVDLIARMTTKGSLPDGIEMEGDPIEVLYITGEDDPEQVILPRLVAAGGDPAKVKYWTDDFVMPDDLDALKEALALFPEVGLVLIDPLFSHIDSEINTGRDTEIRRKVMDPLQDVAAEAGVCMVIARHLNKTSGVSIGLKGSGSYGGLTGRARSVISVISDPEDPLNEMRLFGVHKCNYGKMPRPLRFAVQEYRFSGAEGYGAENLSPLDTFPTISWRGPASISMEEAYEKLERQRTQKATDSRMNRYDEDLIDVIRKHGNGGVITRDEALQHMRADYGHGRDATDGALNRVCRMDKVVDPSKKVGEKGREKTVWVALPGVNLYPETAGSAGSAESADLDPVVDETHWRRRRAREAVPTPWTDPAETTDD